MAKQKSSELWDDPVEPQETETEAEQDEEASWEPRARRMAATRSEADWDDEDDGWLDDPEEAPQGCDEGEVYRLLGKPGRRQA